VLDGLVQVSSGSVPHLSDDEGTDLRWRVLLASSLDPSVAVGVGDNLVRDVLDVLLNLGVGELSSDQTVYLEPPLPLGNIDHLPLGSEDGVFTVDNGLSSSRLSN